MKLSLDVGCGFLREHRKRGQIGIDLQKGLCDIVADAQNMPFPRGFFDEVVIFDVLEHLDEPLECLKEVNRVAKDNAEIFIKIPYEPKMFSADVFMLKKLFFEFPSSILGVIRYYWVRERHKHLKGYMHINDIQPKHIAKFFTFLCIQKKLEWSIRVVFFRRYLRKITERFLREPQMGLSSWVIRARKRALI